jgi:hypothetical protein
MLLLQLAMQMLLKNSSLLCLHFLTLPLAGIWHCLYIKRSDENVGGGGLSIEEYGMFPFWEITFKNYGIMYSKKINFNVNFSQQ